MSDTLFEIGNTEAAEPVDIQALYAADADTLIRTLAAGHRAADARVEFVAVRQLAGRFGYTPREIAKRTGLRLERVQRLLDIAALQQDLVAAFERGDLKRTVAEAITRCTGLQAAALVAKLRAGEKITGPVVDAVRRVGRQEAAEQLEFDETRVIPWSAWEEAGALVLAAPDGRKYSISNDDLDLILEGREL
jgi:ParB-like chromosome segregation protein Spo0J